MSVQSLSTYIKSNVGLFFETSGILVKIWRRQVFLSLVPTCPKNRDFYDIPTSGALTTNGNTSSQKSQTVGDFYDVIGRIGIISTLKVLSQRSIPDVGDFYDEYNLAYPGSESEVIVRWAVDEKKETLAEWSQNLVPMSCHHLIKVAPAHGQYNRKWLFGLIHQNNKYGSTITVTVGLGTLLIGWTDHFF